MPNISLNDILISARQESHRMRHYYLGVEHIFIALLNTHSSVTSLIIREHGLEPEYVIDAIRRKVGKGGKKPLWAGMPKTPRTEALLAMAHEMALENNRQEIDERDLLVAFFRDGKSLPILTLRALGLHDLEALAERVLLEKGTYVSPAPHVQIEFGPDFDRKQTPTNEELFVLRRMFYEYSRVRLERRLTGSFSNATVLVVTPLHMDNRQDAAVVVKIGPVDAILDEARRYETHVKTRLPPLTARLEEKPTTPEASLLAGIKYTLIAGEDQIPQDLRGVMHQWTPERIGHWLKDALYPTFGHIWWKQNRPFRFPVWREYDWMLPPLLTLEMVDEAEAPPDVLVLSMPIRLSRLNRLEYGDIIAVKNFIVQKVSPENDTMQLAAGHGTEAAKAYKIEIRNMNSKVDTFYRGEVVEYVVGRLWQTRNEQLLQALRTLQPNFDPRAEKIPMNIGSIEKLPNPIIAYESLLEEYVNGSLCTIHGDLHPGNIMIGPGQSPFLIDFGNTRDGHTVFDWATLETSLLSDVVMPIAGESWEDARQVLKELLSLNQSHLSLNGHQSPIAQALSAVALIRQVVAECLEVEDQWSEYFMALAFCGLRALTWETMPIAGRRLMFLVAGLCIHEIKTRNGPKKKDEDDSSPSKTDID